MAALRVPDPAERRAETAGRAVVAAPGFAVDLTRYVAIHITGQVHAQHQPVGFTAEIPATSVLGTKMARGRRRY